MGEDAKAWQSSPPNYVQYEFNFHHVAVIGSLVFDAAAAHWLDLSENTFQEPPAAWNISAYLQVTETWTSPSYNPINEDPDAASYHTWLFLGLTFGLGSLLNECVVVFVADERALVELL